ncbi:hypothetical protein [Streptomyces armeniacus]|nr:hypothetical protein [Streptomyces armeniacus]
MINHMLRTTPGEPWPGPPVRPSPDGGPTNRRPDDEIRPAA